jgi:Na+-translocating ferredoxin:NAD+ oxidoreductase RnfD subunit
MTPALSEKPSPSEKRKISLLAISSLLVAVVTALLLYVPYVGCLGFLSPLVAIILGSIVLIRLRKQGNQQKEKGFAITGIIIGLIWYIVIPILLVYGR